MLVLYELFVWLLISYGCAGLIALVAARVVDSIPLVAGKTPLLVKIYLQQSAEQLEATVRSLQYASRWQGKPICICLADRGSTDDTPEIIQILVRNNLLYTREESASEPDDVLDLSTSNNK
jgi:hypothetical protein